MEKWPESSWSEAASEGVNLQEGGEPEAAACKEEGQETTAVGEPLDWENGPAGNEEQTTEAWKTEQETLSSSLASGKCTNLQCKVVLGPVALPFGGAVGRRRCQGYTEPRDHRPTPRRHTCATISGRPNST